MERKKLALVLAGGGITGAVYELGSLRALDDAFGETGSVNHFDLYVGTSAGSVVASFLANGIHPEIAVKAMMEGAKDLLNFQREDVYRPNYKFLFRTIWSTLQALSLYPFRKIYDRGHARGHARGKISAESVLDLVEEKLPSGIFRLDHLEAYIRRILSAEGRANDFRQLKRELYIPATELDTGERWVFGDEGLDEIPISQAVAASSAIPIFFQPYRIQEHDFVDGAVKQIGNIDIAIAKGASSVLVINPLVPIYNDRSRVCIPLRDGHCARIIDRGLVSIFNQSARINLHDKLHLGLGYFQSKYPDVKIVLHEPSRLEAPMFLKNPMTFQARAELLDYGYASMKAQLQKEWDRFHEFFGRHGIQLQEKGVFGDKGREAFTTPPPQEQEEVDLFHRG
ncbi:MAG: patatin-like phospholipase family protein [Deltaproteobacteria bacterium]|nr:patatin-like phospholipase family protein [Deltaproteobacteria bacterium]